MARSAGFGSVPVVDAVRKPTASKITMTLTLVVEFDVVEEGADVCIQAVTELVDKAREFGKPIQAQLRGVPSVIELRT